VEKLFTTRKRRLVVAGAALALAIGVASAAFAYFTTTGTGPGSATAGSSTVLTIVQTNAITGLTPGGPAQPVAFTINNPSPNGDQTLGVVSATVTSVTPTGANVCTTANFTTTAAGAVVGEILNGGTFTSTGATEPTVQMVETGANQDGCEGATVNLTLTAAAGT
jgi:hypothetical protein